MKNQKITVKLLEKVIDKWESITDINQYRDIFTQKELKELYKKVAEEINGR